MNVSLTINSQNNAKPVALVAPLDWGLGHASRCINIIKLLLIAGYDVVIASEGVQNLILASEFPSLKFVKLYGYRIKYGSKGWLTQVKILMQIPKILIAIKRERSWLHDFASKNQINLIISDNRYGFYHPDIPSVFVTHQLEIKIPFGKWMKGLLQRINYAFINKFNECWIPDTAGEINLAGTLAHVSKPPLCKLVYVGILSRIKKLPLPIQHKLLVLLSGPEPQRTILENRILAQLIKYKIPAVFVRGLAAELNKMDAPSYIEIHNFLNGSDLEKLINQSAIIVSRSGYTTIMELMPLGKKCIFIPTPGQTEQEYLATYLTERGWACSANQQNFSLPQLIDKANNLQLPDLSSLKNENALRAAIDEINNAYINMQY